ncbi:MAG: hypothetical protein KA841_06765 [Chitinophagales bacterium]|nr:hypothetical protein [Chitinophagales bacterium]
MKKENLFLPSNCLFKMRLFVFCFLLLFFQNELNAQITHAVSFQVGVTETMYVSKVENTTSTYSHLMPLFAIDYARYSYNAVWASVGYGFSPRKYIAYKEKYRVKYGVEYPDFWFRLRGGLKFENEKTTHLPHIGIGLSVVNDYQFFVQHQQQVTYGGYYVNDTLDFRRFSPYIEVSHTMINSSFRENKFNVFCTLGLRYYPMPFYKTAVQYEYTWNNTVSVQSNLIEVFFCIGFQRNFHRD